VSILNSVVQVVANEPAPNLDEVTGNEVVALSSFDTEGKLQLCFGGLTGAQVVRGLVFLHSDTWLLISSIRFSKYARLKAVAVPSREEVHLKVAPLIVTMSSKPSSFRVRTTSQRLMYVSSIVVEVAPLTVVLQPATTGVAIGVVVESVSAEAFVLRVIAVITTVIANMAELNFFADMACSLNEVTQVIGNPTSVGPLR
jgi:hypothetical protein